MTACFLLLGHIIWRPCSCLSSWWTLLLSVTSRVLFFSVRRPCTCSCLYCIYVGLLRFLLQDVDWSFWLLCQRCKFKMINYVSLHDENRWAVVRIRLTSEIALMLVILLVISVICINSDYVFSVSGGRWGQNGGNFFPVYCFFKTTNNKPQIIAFISIRKLWTLLCNVISVRAGKVTGKVETPLVLKARCTVCEAVAT